MHRIDRFCRRQPTLLCRHTGEGRCLWLRWVPAFRREDKELLLGLTSQAKLRNTIFETAH